MRHAGSCLPHISIHAPTRGATESGGNLIMTSEISIHAPTRGATEGETPLALDFGISIHAPTRGATAIFAKKFSFLSAKIV